MYGCTYIHIRSVHYKHVQAFDGGFVINVIITCIRTYVINIILICQSFTTSVYTIPINIATVCYILYFTHACDLL